MARSSFCRRSLALLAALGVTLLLPGCLINVGGTKVIDEGVSRRAIDFESEEGMAAFVRHVDFSYPAEKVHSSGYFGIPFIIGVSEKRVLSENSFFNRMVNKIDLNQDAQVSDAELRASGIAVNEKPAA